jgi:transposase-like protein
MKLHANAALSLTQRRRMVRLVVEQEWSIAAAAAEFNTSSRTCSKWVTRYREASEIGLLDRCSAPKRVHNKAPEPKVAAIEALRRIRMTGPEIAELLEMATSTTSAVLKRIGLGKFSRLEPPEPIRRYEKRRAGELIHIDVKKLGRINRGPGHRIFGRQGALRTETRTDSDGVRRSRAGYECVHVCIDDATRLAYAEVLPDERKETAIGFLERSIDCFASHGIRVERLMTDTRAA